MPSQNDRLERPEPAGWIMPVAWCVVTAAIVASGLAVPLEGGPTAAGFPVGEGGDFMQRLALYSVFAAGLAAAFMFAPKVTRWRFRKGMAWSTFMLVAIGGVMMLVVPQLLLDLAQGYDASLALAWSSVWMDAGARISIAGGLVALATFLDAWMHRA
jgi:hypothetical protein